MFAELWHQSLGPAGPLALSVTDDLVLIGGGTAPLVARAVDDGHDVWTSSLVPIARPVSGDHLVFVASADRLSALDEEKGAVRWQDDVPSPAGALIWRSGWLFVSTSQALRAYRAADGTRLWRYPWPAAIASGPVINGDRLVAGLADTTVVCLDIKTTNEVWRTPPLGFQIGSMLAANGRVYFGGSDGNVHARDDQRGQWLWDFRARAGIIGAPVADAAHLYVTLLDNTVRALDAESGTQRWSQPLGARAVPGLLLLPELLAVPLASGDLLTCPPKTCKPARSVTFPTPPDAPPGFFHRLEAVAASPDGRRAFLVTASLQEERTLTAMTRPK
ncbi:MAG: PQQ-binding-like beta-propeller repeat protein [Vicinamibacterales bacterium]